MAGREHQENIIFNFDDLLKDGKREHQEKL